MSENNLYAYGVVAADEEVSFALESEGVEGAAEVESVDHRTLAAIVSDIGEMEPEETDANTRAHDDVLQEVLTRDGGRTVVPMRFGMVFKNARSLKSVLRGARPAFTRALGDIEGTCELGVKLVAEGDADLDREAVRSEASDRLSAVSEGESRGELFSDRLVFNRSYLVDRDERDRFDDAVEGIEENYDEMLVRYTGPWAPYSFVDIEIGAER